MIPNIPEVGAQEAERVLLNPQMREAIQRTQRNAIAADLRDIQADLRLDLLQAQTSDSVTKLILTWHQLFTKAIEVSETPQQEHDRYKQLLQQILVDAIFNSALDESCLLGSDGESYSEMGLQVYKSLAPAQFQNRSPLHPEIEAPFETRPHLIARHMVSWLVRHNTNHRNAKNEIVEEAYRQLKAAAERLPPAQVDQDEATRKIMAHRAARKIQREKEREGRIGENRLKLEEQYKAEALPIIQEKFAQVKKQFDEGALHHIAQVVQLNQQIHKEINEVECGIEKVKVEFIELKERQNLMKEQGMQIQADIIELRQTHGQLEMEKIQLKEAIEAREQAGLQTLVMIGFCAVGSWAIKYGMSAMGTASGATVSLQPRSSAVLLKISF